MPNTKRMNALRRWISFNRMYFGQPPWDTGVSPPELMAFITTQPAGRALDLGCGTGTNVVTLAQHGWDATGVDFALRAIRLARKRAKAANVRARFVLGDVSRVRLPGAFDLILDIGCFHALDAAAQGRYAAGVKALLARDGTFLLYAHFRVEGARRGLNEGDLDRFGPELVVASRVDGTDTTRGGPSAWFTLARRSKLRVHV